MAAQTEKIAEDKTERMTSLRMAVQMSASAALDLAGLDCVALERANLELSLRYKAQYKLPAAAK